MKTKVIIIFLLIMSVSAQNKPFPFANGLALKNNSSPSLSGLVYNNMTVDSVATIKTIYSFTGNPTDMVYDSKGNLFVSTHEDHRIIKITPDGTQSNFAGSGVSGFVDGLGELAQFYVPAGLAIGKNDTLYVADYSNHSIRKISPDGQVETLAGNGSSGNSDAVGTAASFNYPCYIDISSDGTIFVADLANEKIRAITPSGAVSTFAGSGVEGHTDGTGTAATFDQPFGLEIDKNDNLYISEDDGYIRKITPSGVVTKFFSHDNNSYTPADLSFDSQMNLYYGDVTYHNIYKLSSDAVSSFIAGKDTQGDVTDGKLYDAYFGYPYDVMVSPKNDKILYIADYINNVIRKVSFNSPPIISTIDDVTIKEDESTTISLSATDAEDDSISFIVSSPAEETALFFDGENDYVSIGHPIDGSLDFDNNIFSYSVWFKTTNPEFQQIICKRGGGGNFEMQMTRTLSANYATTSDTLNDGIWHNAVWTSNGDTVRLYVDGNLNSTSSIADDYSASGTGPLNFGADSYQGEYFKGSIDEVAIWDTTLSNENVIKLYNSGIGNKASLVHANHLAGYWKIDEGKGYTTADSSSNSNDGIIDGATWITSSSDFITSTISGSSLTLSPDPNWNGQSIISVIAEDQTSYDTTSFTLTVTPVQDPPSEFDWVSTALDTINLSQSNLNSLYDLEWTVSNDVDGDSINYLLFVKIGVYEEEEIWDTTSTKVQISYSEILEGVFEGQPINEATVRFVVNSTDGIDTVDVTGEDRVLYVNRYDYLSTESDLLPTEYALHENFPNPFNPSTTLRFDLPYAGDVSLTIYNMLGQKVKSFDMRGIQAGKHTLRWNATNDLGEKVGTGVYLYQLQTKDFMKTRKMIFMK